MHSQFILWLVMLLCVLLLVCALLVQPGAGAACDQGKVRLRVNDLTENAYGRVEYCVGTEWRSVCDQSWGEDEARVVCRELEFGAAKPMLDFGGGSSDTVLIDCNTTADSLDDCDIGHVKTQHCGHAGVICYDAYTNTNGSFTCACNTGYSGNGTHCEDVDECVEELHACHQSAFCTNIPSSYICTCNAGYTGNGMQCDDVNECWLQSHNCHPSAVCTNTNGSFTCACNTGYSGNGNHCKDVDECVEELHACHQSAFCTNIPSSYICTCNAGYTGDGMQCDDIDECGNGTHSCDLNANSNCVNTEGHYYCEHQEDYRNGSCQRESTITDQPDISPSLACSSLLPVVSAVLFTVSAVFMMVAIAAVVVSIVMVRRRKKEAKTSSNINSSNPLAARYTHTDNEESQVKLSYEPGISGAQPYEEFQPIASQHPPTTEHEALSDTATEPLGTPTAAVNHPPVPFTSAGATRQDYVNTKVAPPGEYSTLTETQPVILHKSEESSAVLQQNGTEGVYSLLQQNDTEGVYSLLQQNDTEGVYSLLQST